MIDIITVRFKSGGRQYFFDPQDLTVKPNQGVIVETARGNEFGTCVMGNHSRENGKIPQPLRKVLRHATDNDLILVEKNRQREKWARKICLEKITHHKLDMKIVGVEYSFEGNKVLFFFTADGRVDFRALVKDLAATIHARIELRQIGVRDESKMLGGLGICGRPFCCNQFLDKFAPVSIKMAKTQNLSLNPAKISGTCGRLMCCLKYEQDAYEHLLKKTPRADSFVETPDGAGTISSINLLRQQVTVRLESDATVAKKYHNSEIVVVRSGRGRRPEGYVQPPLAELEKQRRVVEQVVGETPTNLNPLAAALDAMLNPPAPTVQQKGKGKIPQHKPQNKPHNAPNNQGNQNKPIAKSNPPKPKKGGKELSNRPNNKRRPNQNRNNKNNKRQNPNQEEN